MRREDLEAMTVAELKILLSNLALPISERKPILSIEFSRTKDQRSSKKIRLPLRLMEEKIERQLMKRLNPSSRT